MSKRAVLLTALLLLLGACVSIPDRGAGDPVVELPGEWEAQPAAAERGADGWLAAFDDERLDELVHEALAGNRGVRAFAARVDAAEAQARIAGADRLPQVGTGLSGSRQRQNFIGFPIPGSSGGVLSTTSSRAGLSVDVRWEVDLWGRIRAGRVAAVADTQAASADLAGARLALASRVARTWFAAVEARQQLELSRETAESYRSSVGSVETRYRAGLRPAIDLRLLRSQLAEAESLLALRQETLERTVRQLEVLLGRYPSGAITPAVQLPALPPPVPAGLPADLLSRRPDLVAAEQRLLASDARVAQARAALYPSLSLTSSGGTASSELRDLVDGDFRVWNLVAGLTQPLFQGGRLRASVERAEAGTREALASFADDVLTACAEVETALTVRELLAARELALVAGVRESAAARRISEDEYREGLSDVLVLLEARRRNLLAESQLLSIRRLRLDNTLDLVLALGGSIDADEGAREPSAAARSPETDS